MTPDDRESGLDFEQQCYAPILKSADRLEGLKACVIIPNQLAMSLILGWVSQVRREAKASLPGRVIERN